MAAWPSVMAGKSVLMIERGDWVARGPHNRGADGFFALTPAYSAEAPYRVLAGGDSDTLGTIACVGGASVFFGGVSLRLRERDFEADPEIVGDSGAEWPYRYVDLEPFYSKAEQLLGVAGSVGQDPTEPWRSAAYPQAAPARAAMSDRIARAAQSLGLHPFALPLAINYTASASRQACVACNTCDGFACAVSRQERLERDDSGSRRGVASGWKPTRWQCACVLKAGGSPRWSAWIGSTLQPRRFAGRTVVVAAGALATPHLLLASGLERDESGRRSGRPLPDAPLQCDRDGVVPQEAGASRRVPQAHRYPRLLLRHRRRLARRPESSGACSSSERRRPTTSSASPAGGSSGIRQGGAGPLPAGSCERPCPPSSGGSAG